MIANFFNKTKPINFLVLFVMLFIAYLLSTFFITSEEFSLAYFIRKIMYFLLVIFMLFILDFIVAKNFLTDKNSYSLMFYIMLFGFFPYTMDNSSLLIANFFLLLSFRKMYSLRTSHQIREKIFDSAFWITIASMFYDWSFIFIILIYIAIIQFNKNEWKNFLIPVVGVLIPVFLLYVYFLATDNLAEFSEFWEFRIDLNFRNYLESKYLLPIILVFIMSAIFVVPTTQKALLAKQDFKSCWILIIFQILISLFIVVVTPLKNTSEFIFLFFPISILLANYLQNIEKYWYKEVIIYTSLILFISVYIIW